MQTSEKFVFGIGLTVHCTVSVRTKSVNKLLLRTIQLTLTLLFWVHWQVFSGEMQRIAIKKMTPRIVLSFAKKSRK